MTEFIDRRAAHQGESPPIEAARSLAVDLDPILANLVSCASVQSAINNMRAIGNLGIGTVTENGEALPVDRLYRRITNLGTQHVLAVHKAGIKHGSSCENTGFSDWLERFTEGVMFSSGWG